MAKGKIPITPAMLAAGIVMAAGGMLETIEKNASDTKVKSPDKWKALGEIISAYYCLAITVLGEDDFAAEPNLWNAFTALTYEELARLAGEMNPSIVLDRLVDEAVELYLHDKPKLPELAQKLPDFSLGMLVQQAEETNDWFCAFMTKAYIRISASLGVPKTHMSYLPLWYFVGSNFLANVEVFRQMRPVFMEQTR